MADFVEKLDVSVGRSRIKTFRIVLTLIPLLLAFSGAGASNVFIGKLPGPVTKVRDADTIEVAGVPIRLQGIAAPELNEPGRRWLRHDTSDAGDLTTTSNHDRRPVGQRCKSKTTAGVSGSESCLLPVHL